MRTKLPDVLLFIWFVSLISECFAGTILVTKSGEGYTTIQQGLNTADPGDTVLVKAGIYNEHILWPKSGTMENGPITLKAFGCGKAVVDGTGIPVVPGDEYLLMIRNTSYVEIIGMEFRNCIVNSGTIFNKGIQIEGVSQHILIKNCKIHHIENTNPTISAGSNAIGVYGTESSAPITDIHIDSCEIYENKTGYGEAISIDGNVDSFSVVNCHVHDNNNSGILVSGSYGECLSCTDDKDKARNGIITGNRIERCSNSDNPSYHSECPDGCGKGIYVDGTGKVIFERNIVMDCDIGIEIECELPGKISDIITMRDNFIYNNRNGGLFICGYDTRRGWAHHCVIKNNTLYSNDTHQD